MGRTGSCLDSGAESFFSTLEWEVFRTTPLATKHAARRDVASFIDWYNRIRRHSSCGVKPPVAYEAIVAAWAAQAVDAEQAA
jgi:transposase InsO family protein